MTRNTPSPEIVVWVSNPQAAAEGGGHGGFEPTSEVQTHAAFWKKPQEAIEADPRLFLDTWGQACKAVAALFTEDDAASGAGPFRLETVSAKLALSARGKIAFVGELGGSVAFEAVFKRREVP